MRLAIFFWLVVLGLTSACTKDFCGKDKDEFLVNYYALVQTVGETKNKPSASDWQKYDEEFRTLLEECYPLYAGELSKGQKRTFWAKSTQYYYYRYGGEVLNALANETNSVSRLITREVEARWSRPSEAIEEATMNSSRNWKKVKERMNKK